MRALLFALTIAAVLVPAPAGAQLLNDSGRWWFTGSTCPAGWVTLSPPETRPMELPRFSVTLPNGRQEQFTNEAVLKAYTVNGTVNQAAIGAAVVAGTVAAVQGRPPQVRCDWRPLGGSP